MVFSPIEFSSSLVIFLQELIVKKKTDCLIIVVQGKWER